MELLQHTFTDFLSETAFLDPRRLTESAWLQHVPFAFWLAEQARPKLFVELGVHTGVSYFAFCQSIKANRLSTLCYGIDTWKGDAHAGIYGDEIWRDVQDYNVREYAPFSYLLRTTFNDALAYFDNESVDLLHIDGYHTYEAVKEDFESWLPKMTTNGIVVFHDIVVREREFGVYKFWTELKARYLSFEFIHNHGLGVLALGEPASPLLNALFHLADENETNKIRLAYAALGTRLTEGLETILLHNQSTHLNAQNQRLQTQHAQLQQDKENLQASYEHIHEEHQTISSQYGVLKKLLSQAEADCATLTATAGQTEQAFSLLQTELKNTTAICIVLEQETSELKAINVRLEQETELLKKERDAATQLHADERTANAGLQDQYEQLKKFLENFQHEHTSVNSRYEQLQKEHHAASGELQVLHKEYSIAQQQLEQHRQQELMLTEDLKKTKDAFHHLRASHTELNKMIQQTKEQARQMELDRNRWKDNFENSNQELHIATDELAGLKQLVERTAAVYEKEKGEVRKLLNEQTSRLSDLMHELSAGKLLTETLQSNIRHQQEAMQWYKRTYEDRKLLGIIKDRLFAR